MPPTSRQVPARATHRVAPTGWWDGELAGSPAGSPQILHSGCRGGSATIATVATNEPISPAPPDSRFAQPASHRDFAVELRLGATAAAAADDANHHSRTAGSDPEDFDPRPRSGRRNRAGEQGPGDLGRRRGRGATGVAHAGDRRHDVSCGLDHEDVCGAGAAEAAGRKENRFEREAGRHRANASLPEPVERDESGDGGRRARAHRRLQRHAAERGLQRFREDGHGPVRSLGAVQADARLALAAGHAHGLFQSRLRRGGLL